MSISNHDRYVRGYALFYEPSEDVDYSAALIKSCRLYDWLGAMYQDYQIEFKLGVL